MDRLSATVNMGISQGLQHQYQRRSQNEKLKNEQSSLAETVLSHMFYVRHTYLHKKITMNLR